ncbi:hypothetical protein B0A55_03164 [Friedmanniomyces simplex]|uniref:Uncharacterized protein n=1 Tax=Friedmanniomyces simplex TaxID=329884 RepID=A0A4U0XTH5_9PEZI|nr:hypothetical protein B0A55_03164 [Friedmanniomyces simplex]
METPHEASAEPNAQGGGEPSGEDHEHHRDTIQVEDSQHDEADSTISIPTATGHQEAVRDTQPDDERPGTANSMHSDYANFGNSEDGTMLAGLTVPFAKTAGADGPITKETQVFTRPSIDTEVATPSFFAFGKATKHQMDMVGTRKGPAAAVTTLIAKTFEKDVPAQGQSKDVSDLHNIGVQELAQEHVALPEQHEVDEAARAEQPMTQPAETGSKKRKKRKKRTRQNAAPTEQPAEHADVAHSSVARWQQEERAPDADHAFPSTDRVAETDQTDHAEVFEPAAEYLDPTRPGTPIENLAEADFNGAISSPHSQLQDDLHAASFEQFQIVDLTADDMEDEGAVIEAKDDASQSEQSMPAMVRDDYIQGQPAGMHPAGVIRRAPNRPDYSRVLKRYPRAGQRVAAPTPVQRQPSEPYSSDVFGEAHEALLRVQRKNETLISQYHADRAALDAELQRVTEAKQQLQADLDEVQQQKGDMSILLEQQRGKISAYEGKLNRFRTFVDGLGNDVNALKREAGVTRRKGDELIQEGEDRKAEQAALFEQISSCAEKSAQLKDQALKACQEAHFDVQAVHLRNEYLEKQLSERIGLLAEERDRRAHLERQLVTVASSDEVVRRTLKSNNDAVLDKLYEIHATLEDAGNDKIPAEMVEKTLAAIQALTSQQSSNADDLVSVKDMIESISDSVTSLATDAEMARVTEQSAKSSLQATLADAFKELKNDLSRREQLMQQEAVQREMVRGLQDKITASNIRSNDLQTKLHDVEQRELRLKDANHALQTRIDTLRSDVAPERSGHLPPSVLRAEVSAKAMALESAKAELTAKAEELRTLGDTNARLEEQSRSLQQKLEEVNRQLVDVDVLRKDLEDKSEAELKKHRKELQEHADRNVADHMMKVNNKLRMVATQRDSLEKKIPALNEEVAASKAKIEELRSHAAELARERDGELEQLRQQAQGWEHKAETVQSQLDSVQAAGKMNKTSKKEYDAVCARLAQKKDKLHQSLEERAALAKHMEELQQALESTQSREADVKALLERSQVESGAALKQARKKLVEAEEAFECSEAGVQHLKENCENEVAAAMRKAERQIGALQQRATEAETDAQRQKDEGLRFRAEVEETWRNDEARHDQNLIAANNRATQAEAQQKEALAETERLRKELESVVARHAEEQLRSQQRQSLEEPAIRVPPAVKGITPTMSNKENEPPRPRRKVDRNAGTVIEFGPVPVPEILRRPESRAKSAEDAIRGPVVEDSKLKDLPAKRMLARTFSELTDDMLDRASTAHGHRRTQVIEETQFDDQLPSFAALNSMTSSHALKSKPASSVCSMPSVSGGVGHSSDSDKPNGHEPQSQPPADELHSFAVYEDHEQSQVTLGTQAARDQLHDSLHWPEAEKKKYSFRKSYPVPNSASKMVHRDGEHESYRKRSDTTVQSDKRTAEIRGESRASSGTSKRTPESERHSSTPDFVGKVASGRKMSTYRTTEGSGPARRHSGIAPRPVADPRLTQRAATKRKAPPTTTEGYEHERKKRMAAKSGDSHRNTESSRYALRGAAQPSIRDLPSLERPANGRGTSHHTGSSSQAQSQTQSRMRTLGRGASRGVRGTGKMSKTDEFNARFSQELSL